MIRKTNWQHYKIKNAQHQQTIYKDLNNIYYLQRKNKEITLENGNKYIEFISCSYLGLDQHQSLCSQLNNDEEFIDGIIFSSSRSRMQPLVLKKVEDNLEQIFGKPTILFPNIHTATLGILPLLCSGEMPSFRYNKTPFIIIDKFAHASIQINRGLINQFGEYELVDCNDTDVLESILLNQSKNKQIIILTDSVRSTGIGLDIKKLCFLSQRYNAYIFFDDAHGMSVYGQNGAGYVLSQMNSKLPENVLMVTSLAKGFGASGAALILPKLKDSNFVRTYCSTYMFSGQFYNSLLKSIKKITDIHLSKEILELQKKLWDNINYFDNLFDAYVSIVIINHKLTTTPIRGIFIGDENIAIQFGLELKSRGFLVVVSTYPIVEKEKAFIRILISANHTKQQIELLSQAIKNI